MRLPSTVSPRARLRFRWATVIACIMAIIAVLLLIHSSMRFHARAGQVAETEDILQTVTLEVKAEVPAQSNAPSPPWNSSTEAQTICCLLFNLASRRLTSAPVPAEMQRDEAKPALDALDKVWMAFRYQQRGLCQDKSGLELIKSLAAAVDKLNSGCSSKKLLLPYTLIRRMAWSLLKVLHESDCQRSMLPNLIGTFTETFAATLNCSRRSRGILELLHISKSGGTSVCQLASKSQGLYNPFATLDKNCLMENLDLDPKWTRNQPGEDPAKFWPSVQCPAWAEQSEVTCANRKATVKSLGIEFFSAEGPLHMSVTGRSPNEAGSAGPCMDVESLIVLRNPLERARSHIVEVHRVYSKLQRYGRGPLFELAGNLENWAAWAPAVLDNYITRMLLGRAFHACRDAGSLTGDHLDAALLTLSSIDQIVVIGEDSLNDVIFKGALGWRSTLKSKRWRWAVSQDLRALGFQGDTLKTIEENNRLDEQVVNLGRELLQLDASFHLAVAVKNGKVADEPESSCGSSSSSSTEPSPEKSSPGSKGNSEALGNISHTQAVELAAASTRSKSRFTYVLKEVPGTIGRKTYIRQYTAVTTDNQTSPKFVPGVNAKLQFGYVNLDDERMKEGQSFLAEFPFNLHRGGCVRLTKPIYLDIRRRAQDKALDWDPELGNVLAQSPPRRSHQLSQKDLEAEADRINRRFEDVAKRRSPDGRGAEGIGSFIATELGKFPPSSPQQVNPAVAKWNEGMKKMNKKAVMIST